MSDDLPPMVNVRTPKGTQGFVQSDWETLLEMARLYGWQPMGTLPATNSPDDRCNGIYFPAMGQRVLVEDACALANSLRSAYADIPETEGEPLPEHIDASERIKETMTYYTGMRKRLLLRFIEMCEIGELCLFREGMSHYISP